MLVRLLYASRLAASADAQALAAIVRQSQRHNTELGVTGLLCCSGDLLMQVLEGARSAVNGLYSRIVADPRHSQVELLLYDEITERRFAGWAMGLVDLGSLNPALLLKYSETAALDPYKVPGRASMALLEELAATASVCGHS